jgi:hypothetical protein
MRSGKQRRAEIKAARLRRAAAKIARLQAELRKRLLPPTDTSSAAYVPVDPTSLAADNSYGVPEFVQRGYYLDMPFHCVDCGSLNTCTAAQQKWWYEVAKGNVWSMAKRCRECRAEARQRREQARKIHLEGLQRSKHHPRL